MKFLIVGFGRVGMRTARVLQSEGHDLVIVDNDPEKVERARGEGFTVVEGDALSVGLPEFTASVSNLPYGISSDMLALYGKRHGPHGDEIIDHDEYQRRYPVAQV